MDFYTSMATAQVDSAANNLGPSLWNAIFIAVMLFFAIYTAILMYHWFKYGMHTRTAIMATIVYLGISSVFIFSMLASIITLTNI